MKPSALFDPQGRRKVAQLVVWGSNNNTLYDRSQIEQRLQKVLERIARKVSNEQPH